MDSEPIGAGDFAALVERGGLSNEEAADILNVSAGTVANWKRGGVPRHRTELVRDRLAAHFRDVPPPLAAYSDVALLAELGRRLAACHDMMQATYGTGRGR